ncbi:MAG: carbon-nitrogen hydrolase [Verrucomicrobiota bacterium]
MPTPETLSIGVIQLQNTGTVAGNLQKAETLIRDAVSKGARIVVSPELIEHPYFCQQEDPKWFLTANEVGEGEGFSFFERLSKELGVVLSYSFFEKANQSYFNSLAIFDGDRGCHGIYRKSHIPDGPNYEEKFYFTPGDTGLRVFDTSQGKIGVGVCWDQWFPEVARDLALQGAECILFPSAIGSEPSEPGMDSRSRWQKVMQGHAVANVIPVAASNRLGREDGPGGGIEFYGSSFIADSSGELVYALGRDDPGYIVAHFDREQLAIDRANWGFLRDRRPELYRRLVSPARKR